MVPESRFSKGAVINDFVIRDVLGTGGMGKVYLAHQVSLDRPVALKILLEKYAEEKEFIIDFIKEARAAARLNHPNIVQSYAVGAEEGIYFFAMEYVEGTTLKDVCDQRQKLPWREAFEIGQQIAEALDFGWKNQQLIHRDVKPDNIMLASNGLAKLADLGLARVAAELRTDEGDQIMGTPQYISPEQLMGHPMDVRGDIYSLGATLYQTITGYFPFVGNSPTEVATQHLTEPLKSPREYIPDLPAEVCWIIETMMEKKPEDRFSGADVLQTAINDVLQGRVPVDFTPGLVSKGAEGHVPQGTINQPAAPAVQPGTKEKLTLRKERPKTVLSRESPARTKGKGTKLRLGNKKKTRLSTAASPAAAGKAQAAPAGKKKTTLINAAGAGEAARQAIAKPKTTNKAMMGCLIFFATVIFITPVVLFGVFYKKFLFNNTYQAEVLYLNHRRQVTESEKADYAEIKAYYTRLINDDEQALREVTMRGAKFIQNYPDSLLTKAPGKDGYPAKLGMFTPFDKIHRERINEHAVPLGGIVSKHHYDYLEALILLVRKQEFELEWEKVEERRYQHDLMLRNIAAQKDIEAHVQKLLGQITELTDTVRRQLGAVNAAAMEDRDNMRRKVMIHSGSFEFAEIEKFFSIKRLDKGDRRIFFQIQRTTERNFPDEADEERVTISTRYDLPEREIRRKLQNAARNAGFDRAIQDLRAAGDEIEGVRAAQMQWIGQHETALRAHREMYEVLSGSQKSLKGKQTNVEIYMLGLGMVTVSNILNDSIIVEASVFDQQTQDRIKKLVPIPLRDIRTKEFLRLAAAVFLDQGGDMGDFDRLKAIYLFYTGHIRANILAAAGEQFLANEAGNSTYEAPSRKLEIERNFRRINRMLDEGNKQVKAKKLFEKTDREFRGTAEWQERREDFIRLLRARSN
ncbi:MAG TPA: hypothetical protein DIT01_07760 [Lentisphaeria bacterium]|nr:hypothetical protein [Lentisphaeria bacterium]